MKEDLIEEMVSTTIPILLNVGSFLFYNLEPNWNLNQLEQKNIFEPSNAKPLLTVKIKYGMPTRWVVYQIESVS
ncbi:MAG TPA: hypothetical protein VEP89_02600, partial [Draconibacterium sp.]|nr:hypothetical protein [Draconibacterium sp.]